MKFFLTIICRSLAVFLTFSFPFFFTMPLLAESVRIKDLVEVKGVRVNELTGVGLVVGLPGTGDGAASMATRKAMMSLFAKLGHATPVDQIVAGSAAIVSVTAKLKTFSQNGDRLDVQIATLGDAASLVGGTLLMTPLKAAGGEVYAVAAGKVSTSSDSSPKAVLTAGSISGGASVEKEFRPEIERYGQVILSLRDPDFTTAMNIADVINTHLSGFFAKAADPVRIELTVPETYQGRVVEFVAEIEQLHADADQKAIVVINERSGTVVSGADIMIRPVAISHGSLTIEVGSERLTVMDATKKGEPAQTTVGSLAAGLTGFGLKPRDLISVLEAMKAAGALHAELKFL